MTLRFIQGEDTIDYKKVLTWETIQGGTLIKGAKYILRAAESAYVVKSIAHRNLPELQYNPRPPLHF